MGSRDHGMVEFGVRIPVAPFDSAEYGLAHGRPSTAESNALSERSESNGLHVTASASADSFSVYIVRCNDGSLYVGHTADVAARVSCHNNGTGAEWTAARLPVVLVYVESAQSEQAAIQRERQIKRWTHAKKIALIQADFKRLKSLAKRRSQ
jgi:putative endonuclease